MGILDFFKKKKTQPDYDAANISVLDLEVGFVFDYDLSTWIVEEVYEYDWGNELFSTEFQINNGTQTRYLYIEGSDELLLSISEKIKIRSIQVDLPEKIAEAERPMAELSYDGRVYIMAQEAPGYFHQEELPDWNELIFWIYEEKDGDHVIYIRRWEEFDFDASAGKYISEFEITNILPQGN